MLTDRLIERLDKAQDPRAVRAITWGLEVLTGHKTVNLIEHKDLSVNDPVTAWYAQNGYYALAGMRGGIVSYSGKSVTMESALESAAVYACVKIISEDLGGLPFFPYERSEDGVNVEKSYGHPLYRCLHDAPNPDMSAGEFREALTARALLGMDGFAKIDRLPDGRILLWPITTPVRIVRNGMFGRASYVVKGPNGSEKVYDRDQIFHLKGFTLDGQVGDDILRRARHAIGLALAGDEYAGRFFAQDASPGVIITRPAGSPALGPENVQKVKDAWKQWHQGLTRSHEPAVLEGGATATRLDPDHQKLQMLESRRYQIVEVARLYRMPLHKLADLDRATNNNIEHQGLEYIQHGLGPWRRRWEEAVHRCLLTTDEQYWPNGRPRMFAEFNVESLIRGDFATQSAGFSTGLQNGYYSINDVRGYMNLNPIEGGDTHRVQVNMQDVTKLAATAAIADGGK